MVTFIKTVHFFMKELLNGGAETKLFIYSYSYILHFDVLLFNSNLLLFFLFVIQHTGKVKAKHPLKAIHRKCM